MIRLDLRDSSAVTVAARAVVAPVEARSCSPRAAAIPMTTTSPNGSLSARAGTPVCRAR